MYTVEIFTIRCRWLYLCLLFPEVLNIRHRGLALLLWIFCYWMETFVSDGKTLVRLRDTKNLWRNRLPQTSGTFCPSAVCASDNFTTMMLYAEDVSFTTWPKPLQPCVDWTYKKLPEWQLEHQLSDIESRIMKVAACLILFAISANLSSAAPKYPSSR